ncbi:MAG TPA: hypothetical protein VFX13_17745 [Gaiellales bacterium]|nr:hypothetical protein [Gaiellales bacterium]
MSTALWYTDHLTVHEAIEMGDIVKLGGEHLEISDGTIVDRRPWRRDISLDKLAGYPARLADEEWDSISWRVPLDPGAPDTRA